jgi:hypothetical protein
MSNNGAISASDPNALEQLAAKLETCKNRQRNMKEVNAYYRKHGTCIGYPELPDLTAAKLDDSMTAYDTQPFPVWQLQNNNAEIKRLEKRIKEITYNREVGFAGWEFAGGEALANTNANRLQLVFDEKPGESQRAQLKAHGFKWAPSQGAWQRQLNDNAIFAAGRLDFVKPTDGRSVREHQPKAPVRDNGAR